MTTVLIIIGVLILFSLGILAFLRWKDKQREQPSEPVEDNKPTTEPEPVEKSMFKKDDWITDGKETMLITEVTQGKYIEKTPDGDMTEDAIAFVDKHFHLWTIQDAKDGDVLYCESSGIEYIVMSKGINNYGNIDSYFRYNSLNGFGVDIPSVLSARQDDITPATKEQRDLLFTKMAEAGYTWDAETKTLSKIEEPTTEPEKPVEPKFKVGDWIVGPSTCNCIFQILDIGKDSYKVGEHECILFENEKFYRLWDTTKDARDGDVLVGIDDDFTAAPWIGIFKCLNKNYPDRMFDSHCFLQAETHTFISPDTESIYENICVGHSSRFTVPTNKEQRDLLFAKMAEAGYTWDAETKTLSKIEEPAPEPKPEPTPEPEPVGTEEPTPEETFERNIDELLSYFSQVVPVGEKTREYIMNLKVPMIGEECFPVVDDYYGTKDNKLLAGAQGYAWIVGMILSELVPAKRNELMQMAYDYLIKGREQPTYGYTFDSDPNIARMIGAVVYAINRDASVIPELRKELDGKMLTYKNDISECYIDCTKFMPTAPAPYLSAYSKRPEGTPVDGMNTVYIDWQIHDYISQYYSLDTKDAEKRQQTIQAIADKEYKKPHLFGKPRTVIDSKYGEMTFNPVFGKHNIGIEIPDNGVIAEMCYTLGKHCSHTRETLLNQEYGRRRPGEGEMDGKANTDPKQRVLVNYAIEEGDGRSTGYYNKNGVYVDNNGVSIGDYETYFQNQVYANSYPSGHSAYIMGVGLILMMIMPERADKILRAVNEYANSRMICRFHWQSDTIHGRVIGSTMVPVLAATTNVEFDKQLNKAKEEYQRILSGDITPEPTPEPEPTEKVNTSLAYAIGGYGSCHVDAGEKEMVHCCTKQCTKERHPSITVNQRVEFTIEGGGVTTDDGKTSGVWEANKPYGIKCPAVTEDKYAYITMRNENGVKVLEYRCSKDGTHDDGPKEI